MTRDGVLWACGAGLLVVTALAFLPTFGADFIRWDDQYYVEENTLLRDVNGLKKIWNPLTHATQQYYPLTFSSYWLEYRLWGLDARGYHATNVGLHLINVLLVLFVVRSFGMARRVAVAVAAVFALHPVQVASVAWISERKNTLSGVFYLLAFLFYLRHRRSGAWGAYGASLLSFVAALLSKTQTVTFAASLIVADVVLQRSGRLRRTGMGELAARLGPMLALGAVAIIVTVQFEQRPWTRTFTPLERLLVAANAAWFYARTFVAPLWLAPVYPEWHVSAADPRWWLAVLAWPVALAGVAYWRQRIGEFALWGAAHFYIVLLPVLGLLSFNLQTYTLVADHFLYLSVIGGGLAVAVWADRLWIGSPPGSTRRAILTAMAALLLAGGGVQTYLESTHWRNNETFWMRVHERDPDGFLGNYNLGNHYRRRSEWSEAVRFYRRACEIRPKADYACRAYAQAVSNAAGRPRAGGH